MPYLITVHTEQQLNTDHASSVVFLLGQKQLFQDYLLGLHTAQFMVTFISMYGEHQFLGPVKVYGGEEAKCVNWTSLIVMCFTHACVLLSWTITTKDTCYQIDLEIPFCLCQQFITIMWKSSRPSLCCKWSKSWLCEGLETMLDVVHLSLKRIVTTENMRPKSDDAKMCYRWLQGWPAGFTCTWTCSLGLQCLARVLERPKGVI